MRSQQRKKLHINSFYDDDISISISDRRAKELFVKDFKKAVKNIVGENELTKILEILKK